MRHHHLVLACALSLLGGGPVTAADKTTAQGYTFNNLPEVIQKSLSVALHGKTDDITDIVRTTLKYTNGKKTGLLYVAKVPQANGAAIYLCVNDKGEIVERQTTKAGSNDKQAK